MEWLSENYAYLGLAILGVLIISFILYFTAKGKLNALKPLVEKFIVEVEVRFQDDGIKKAGIEKMEQVTKLIRCNLPSWCERLLSDDVINSVCQSVYDAISDKLVDLCEEYRKSLK